MKRTAKAFLGSLVALVGLASPAFAQGLVEASPTSRFGIAGVLLAPVGEFDQFVDLGGGVNVYGVVGLDRKGVAGLRFDGSFMGYGHERVTVPLSRTVQRVFVDVTTTNLLASFGMGPQITIGNGPLRPYVYGTVGFSYFATVSSVGGTRDFGDFGSSTNFDDLTFATAVGGGLLISLSEGRRPVALDLSVRSLFNGRTEYLRSGSIIDRPDGSIAFTPIVSDANLLEFRAGFSIGVF